MSEGCSSLNKLKLSNFNTNNATNMSYKLYYCMKLSSFPDILKWNTNNVTDMNYMFYYCLQLSSLPR